MWAWVQTLAVSVGKTPGFLAATSQPEPVDQVVNLAVMSATQGPLLPTSASAASSSLFPFTLNGSSLPVSPLPSLEVCLFTCHSCLPRICTRRLLGKCCHLETSAQSPVSEGTLPCLQLTFSLWSPLWHISQMAFGPAFRRLLAEYPSQLGFCPTSTWLGTWGTFRGILEE